MSAPEAKQPLATTTEIEVEGLGKKVWLNSDEPDDIYKMTSTTTVPPKKPGVQRIWVDGCFDMLHFGHTNAIRQALSLGHELFVGTHTNEEIEKYKGKPIMNAEERYAALRACKWVTFVVENYPYVTRLKDMDRFEIDYVAHGDDISTDLNGRNSYQEIIDANRFKIVKRTDGISTTDLVGRMLLCTKGHHDRQGSEAMCGSDSPIPKDSTTVKYFPTTSRKIVQFSNNCTPSDTDKVVYVDGSFDLFHVGHMKVLEEARKHGTYLIAGIHEDSVVNHNKGLNYPIMNLNERVLGVLSCRHVDEVVMGVPYHVTADLMASLGVHVVVAGRVREALEGGEDPYAVPKEKGVYEEVDSASHLTTEGVISRVVEARQALLDRQAKKAVKDKAVKDAKPAEYQNIKEVA